MVTAVDAERGALDDWAMASKRIRNQKGVTLSEEAAGRLDALADEHGTTRGAVVEASVGAFFGLQWAEQERRLREVDPHYGRGYRAILALLEADGPLTRGEIAARLDAKPFSVNAALAKLRAAGLVQMGPETPGRWFLLGKKDA